MHTKITSQYTNSITYHIPAKLGLSAKSAAMGVDQLSDTDGMIAVDVTEQMCVVQFADVMHRDVNKTLRSETETRPRRLASSSRRDRDRDIDRPRPISLAETETFFETLAR